MKVWPVVIDSTPAYLRGGLGDASLLAAPLGRELLVSALCDELREVTSDAPTIVAPPDAAPGYRARIAALAPGDVTVVDSARELAHVLVPAETSDLLLFLDPRCLPVRGWRLTDLVAQALETPGMAHHLVAYAADVGGTLEYVNVDDEGLVRSVHRYFRPVTWPFIAGVAACLVPVSSGVLPLSTLPASLFDLREHFVSRGVPTHDTSIADGAFDLSSEDGMLAAMERSVLDVVPSDGASTVVVGSGHVVDPSARLLGPIVVHAGARIEARATVVGPAVIGPGASVAADALIAHVSVGAEAVVPAGRTLRDCVWCATSGLSIDAAATAAAERRPASFSGRLARHGADVAEPAPSVAPRAAASRWYPAVKRAFDATVAALAVVALAPLLALTSLLVWLDSRGPVFFRHTREGVGGRPFGCLKFRTMLHGANDMQRELKSKDKLDGPHFKMDRDPRVTRVGRWLRLTNLDELPQLINVLVGDMSLVGPRPSPFRENQICVPWREGRLSVRPGITGLWQICRHDRDAGDFHQWIEYDLLYVQHMGPLLDLKVMAATALTLGGKYPVPVSWLVRPGAPLPVVARAPQAEPAPSGLAHRETPARSVR